MPQEFAMKLPSLEIFDMRGNSISSAQLDALITSLPTLSEIWVQGNPCSEPGTHALHKLSPHIEAIDGVSFPNIKK